MPDTDPDTERERTADPRLDNWPVRREETYADWSVERTVPGEDDAAPETAEEVEWVGFLGEGAEVVGPVLYDPETSAVVRGELDEENERVVVGDDHERREVESDDSLAEHIEAFGEDHGWTWLSSFAREYLEDDDDLAAAGPTLEHSEFDRRNLGASATQDLGFFGSHTYTDATDRVYTLEREFDVFLGGDGGDEGGGGEVGSGDVERVAGTSDERASGSDVERAVVAVEEELLAAREPREEDRRGDADVVEEAGYEFAVDVDAGDPNWDRELELAVEEWHADHPAPRTD